MKFFVSFIDKLIFGVGVLLFLQVPAFINQYTHRIIGYHEALSENIKHDQTIADLYYQGNLDHLIADYQQNYNEAIQQTGNKIADTIRSSKSYKEDYLSLTQNGLIKNIFYLITHMRIDLIRNAGQTFQPNITLNMNAIICGLSGGLLLSLLLHIILYCIQLPFKRYHQRHSNQLYFKNW